MQTESVAQTTELSGRTTAYGIAEIRPQVSGLVQKRLFTEGRDVRAGEPLYQIDPAPYEVALESARASLAKSEATVTSARLLADRYRSLVAIQAVSQQDYDDAEAAQKQAEATVAADRASVRTAEINLGYTRVTSPISGRVGRSLVTPGALVTANQADLLATVQQLDPIYVDVTQSSAELLRLRRDLAAGRLKSAGSNQASIRLRLEDGTDYAMPGRLRVAEVSVDEETGAVTLRAVFPNPKAELLPGMYVQTILEEGVNDHAILVPQQGVSRDAKGQATTLVLTEDGTVQQRTIETVRAVGDKWLVASGLEPGERVIVEGVQKVKPGGRAKVAGTPAAADRPSMQTAAAGGGK